MTDPAEEEEPASVDLGFCRQEYILVMKRDPFPLKKWKIHPFFLFKSQFKDWLIKAYNFPNSELSSYL